MLEQHCALAILVKQRAIAEYVHEGRVFVEGRPGSHYTIEFRNTLGTPVLAVLSVDGLSVLDGQPAGPASPGFVVEAGQTLHVPGWKLDAKQAAGFTFTGPKQAGYAAQMTGSAGNDGVIGVLVYRPHSAAHGHHLWSQLSSYPPTQTPWYAPTQTPWYPSSMRSVGIGTACPTTPLWAMQNSVSTASVGASNSVANDAVSASTPQLATGFGAPTAFATAATEFERGALHAMLVIYYDTAEGLRRRGIVLSRAHRPSRREPPQAFPGFTGGCVPPPGWVRP